jgi:regulator of sirC expression with transglutaminase-like and TPR domain
MTAFEVVGVLNKIIFGQYGFSGNSSNYHASSNSYLNNVIETKKGNPLSLSIIYSVIAQQLNLPIYGVNLPNHFVLAYMDENGANQYISNGNEYGVLFYINAFSRGSILQKEDITEFLKSIQAYPESFHYQPCSNSDIIRRMLTNLIASFQQVGNAEKVNELCELRAILQ